MWLSRVGDNGGVEDQSTKMIWVICGMDSQDGRENCKLSRRFIHAASSDMVLSGFAWWESGDWR